MSCCSQPAGRAGRSWLWHHALQRRARGPRRRATRQHLTAQPARRPCHPVPSAARARPAPPQEYVRARLLQFAQALAGRISPALSPQMVQSAAFDALQSLPPPDYGGLPLEQRDLQLVFRHDCL